MTSFLPTESMWSERDRGERESGSGMYYAAYKYPSMYLPCSVVVSILLSLCDARWGDDDDGDWETCCWICENIRKSFRTSSGSENAQTRKCFSLSLIPLCYRKKISYFSIFLKSFGRGRDWKERAKKDKRNFLVCCWTLKNFFHFLYNFLCTEKFVWIRNVAGGRQ